MGEVATGNRYPIILPDRISYNPVGAFSKDGNFTKELDELTLAFMLKVMQHLLHNSQKSRKSPI